MKIVKHYWFIAIALITMISFSSCENDEERGFDISGGNYILFYTTK